MSAEQFPTWPVVSSGWIEALEDMIFQVQRQINKSMHADIKSGFTQALLSFSEQFNTETTATVFPNTYAGVTESLKDLCLQINTWLKSNGYEGWDVILSGYFRLDGSITYNSAKE